MIARVPATSANMGPGFDTLGMALTLWAEIGILDGDPGELPSNARAIDQHHPATEAFARLGGTGRLWERSPIPMGRGLGYSAAVRIGGLLLACAQRAASGADVISDYGAEVLAAATALEGHADNAAAALLGGVVVTTGERSIRVPLQFDPAVVVWVPSFSTRTDHSRTKLGTAVPLADAVFNIGRVAYLVAALASGDVAALRHAAEDRIHQPSRFAASPASFAAHEAALGAGAWSSWLSGSGPTVAALCAVETADSVAAAMSATTERAGHCKVLRIDHGGASIEL
ncbi:MAG: thrB [Ilumatobacteraceae bacterium]|nr:thrB [Ilumatobacteraceae bacterium]